MNTLHTATGTTPPASTKRHATLNLAMALATALSGCALPSQNQALAPVEDHSTKFANTAATHPTVPPPTSRESASPAKTAPLPSLLHNAPLRAEPLPPSAVMGPTTQPATPPTGTTVTTGLANATALPPIPAAPGALPNQRTAAPTATPSYTPPVPASSTASAIQPPAPTSRQAASANGVVVTLLGKADDQTAAGQTEEAAATLERALHIEPENGQLWHELAGIRLKQGNLDAAINMAQKSNSLARNQRDLQARNWRLIAVARQKQGQSQAAAEALIKARSMESAP